MQLRFLIIVIAFTARICFSQTFNFRHYTETEGLRQNYIYAISQSDKGYLHLSTGEGICLFDGNHFQFYTNKEVAEKFVNTHYIDERGITWIGHQQKGLSYFRDGKFKSISAAALSEAKVTKISGDDKRNIWVATAGAGLWRVDSSYQLKQISKKLSVINDMCFAGDQHLLLATPQGLFVASITTDGVTITDSVRSLAGKNVKLVIRTKNKSKHYWASVEGEGIYGITNNERNYIEFVHLYNELQSENNNITCMYSDASENLWVSLFGEGIRKISFPSDIAKKHYHVTRIEKKNGLKNQHIQSIFQDDEGNMWFGTFGDGLIEKPLEKFSFYGRKEGIELYNIRDIAVDSTGTVWIGSEKGLACFNRENNTYTKFGFERGFVNDKVNSLLVDSKGKLWIGTENNGIYTADVTSKKFSNFSKKYKLKIATINTLLEIKNKILAGTTEGIYAYSTDKDWVELITTDDGLLHNNIKNLYNDSRNRLWISSHGAPPYYIKDRRITAFKEIANLNTFNINCVTEDKKGNIWIATEGDGLFKYDDKNFVNYKTKDGLLSDYCIGLVTDDNNSVWVSHRNGLSEKKEFLKNFHTHSSSNGLLFFENNLNAVNRDGSGNLWFGTTSGLVLYDPDMGIETESEPKLFITRIKLNDMTYPPSWKIEKKYGYYSVQVDYQAISLTDPKSIKYKYRLLGIDSTWKSTNLHYAEFPRLSDGYYTFQVIACNSNGVYSSKPVEISFTIDPPIWKKSWFYLLVLVSIVLITYVAVFVRIRKLKRSQAILQETVRQKTFLLQREKEQVEKIKTELEHKNKDITDSINYAKRLQDSLLPPEHIMNKLFHKKFFVLYKPKDIVSGDFYWVSSIASENDPSTVLTLAAVIDCTGHGVPGAFLSIVANDFLKQSTSDKNVKNTNDILDYLNRSVISNLNQSSNAKFRVKDGMDISLIAIDYKNHKLYYSGANNPAYVFRKVNDKTELMLLKPTKQAIGEVLERTEHYALQEMNLLSGDTIYLFSDGYADQFGGDNDKKLNYKRFKEILAHAYDLPIGLQKNFIEKKLMEWRRETEQTDDICVMGIRI